MLEGCFFALVAALGVDFFAAVGLAAAFAAADFVVVGLVVVAFFAFTLGAAVFVAALGATYTDP